MDKVLVVKDLLYAKDKAGATSVANLKDVQAQLQDGAVGIYNPKGGALFPAVVVDGDYTDVKEFIFAWNINGTVRLTKGIVRRGVVNVEQGDYIAPVMHTVQAGGTSAILGFDVEDTDVGDMSVRVADNTFSNMYATLMNNGSVYKKASMTVENAVDEIVARLNANTMLPVTATKIGSVTGWGITIQSKTRGQILSLSGEGLLEGMNRDVDGTNASVLPVNGAGVDEDVLKHEEDAAVLWGSANSRELRTGWYSQANGTVQGETYETLTLREELLKPYGGETNVSPAYTLYIPDGADTLSDVISGIVAKLVGGAYAPASSSEPGDD